MNMFDELIKQELGQTLGDGEGQGGLGYCNHGVAKSQIGLGD